MIGVGIEASKRSNAGWRELNRQKNGKAWRIAAAVIPGANTARLAVWQGDRDERRSTRETDQGNNRRPNNMKKLTHIPKNVDLPKPSTSDTPQLGGCSRLQSWTFRGGV